MVLAWVSFLVVKPINCPWMTNDNIFIYFVDQVAMTKIGFVVIKDVSVLDD